MFVIYGLEDGKTAETTIYDNEANPVLAVKAVRNGKDIKVTFSGEEKNFKVESAQGLNIT